MGGLPILTQATRMVRVPVLRRLALRRLPLGLLALHHVATLFAQGFVDVKIVLGLAGAMLAIIAVLVIVPGGELMSESCRSDAEGHF